MELNEVRITHFESLVDKAFALKSGDKEYSLTLTEAKKLEKPFPDAERDSFSLLFSAKDNLPQGTYHFSSDEFEGMDAFMTPVSPNKDGYLYQVIFN